MGGDACATNECRTEMLYRRTKLHHVFHFSVNDSQKKSDQSGLDLAALSPQTGWHGGFKSRLALVAAISHANSSAITKEEKNRMKRGIHE